MTARKTTKTDARPVAKKATVTTKKSTTKSDPMDRDFTYLQDKGPSDLHVTLAKVITQRTDIEITAQQVQAVLGIHPHFQRSKLNKARPTYVALDPAIVNQRSVHMVQAHVDAAVEISQRAKKTTRKRVAKKETAA